jgi:hypothetical protein
MKFLSKFALPIALVAVYAASFMVTALFIGQALGQEPDSYGVNTGLVCKHEAIKGHADLLSKLDTTMEAVIELAMADIASGGCSQLPFTSALEIYSVDPTVYTDFEGDKFYIMQVGDEVYTLGWPGITSDWPAPQEKGVSL